MELLNKQQVASVVLFDLRFSEGEIQYLADSIRYLLENLSDEEMHSVFNDEAGKSLESSKESRLFAEGLYEDLMDLIKAYCKEEYLEKRFKEWKIDNRNHSE
jgi:hypothetical protein